MDGELITWIFVVGGILLMALEMLVPGGVAFFLGFSGLTVGLLRFFGLFEDPITATGVWLGLSMVLTIAIRPFISKYFKGDTSYKHADEDFEAMDEVVEVLEEVNEFDNSGRIRYQGISWQARTIEGTLPAGSRARIKYRQNTTWIVEPSDDLDTGPTLDQIEAPKGDL
jgi:membrane protein implicated in regulation of membrane protease activity